MKANKLEYIEPRVGINLKKSTIELDIRAQDFVMRKRYKEMTQRTMDDIKDYYHLLKKTLIRKREEINTRRA